MNYLILRYKTITSTFFVFAFFIVFSNSASALTCAVRVGACNPGETPLLKMQATDNSHAGFVGSSAYNNLICCSEAGVTVGANCAGNFDIFLKLSAADNAHVEKNTFANYSNFACISVDVGSIACGYSTDCNTYGGGGFTCLGEISGNTNAHIGNCGSSYTEKICCKYSVICVPNFGDACNSNACGGGTIQCDGSCSIAAPPPIYGTAPCNPNACGVYGGTTNNCTGACSGGVPATPYTIGAACGLDACIATGTVTNACTGVCSGPPLTCDDGDVCTTDSCVIGSGCVFSVIPPTCTLAAMPFLIKIGSSSVLSWTTNCADTASIDQGVGIVDPVDIGSVSVFPTSKTTYIMTVSNTGGIATCKDIVHVCGDGAVSGPEFCDTLGNINCSGSRPVCNSDCSECTCLFADKLVWSGNFLGKRQPIMCIITDLTLWILSVSGGITLLMLVLSGILYIFAGANPEAQTKAKRIFNYAVIGLILVLISYAIIIIITDLMI